MVIAGRKRRQASVVRKSAETSARVGLSWHGTRRRTRVANDPAEPPGGRAESEDRRARTRHRALYGTGAPLEISWDKPCGVELEPPRGIDLRYAAGDVVCALR